MHSLLLAVAKLLRPGCALVARAFKLGRDALPRWRWFVPSRQAGPTPFESVPTQGPLDDGGIAWGGIRIPGPCATEHFCLIGAPGSGKTKSLQWMMQSVLPAIRPGSNHRAVIFDAKRDLYGTLAAMKVGPVKILNPFDARGVAWNLSRDITDGVNAVELASILIPQRQESQPFFSDAARSLLGGVIEALIHLAPGRWTLRDVILILRHDARLKKILRLVEPTAHLVGRYITESDGSRDVAATIENKLRRLAFVAAAWEHAVDSFSLRDWVQSESILLLGSNPTLESTMHQLNNAIFHRLTQLILAQGEASEAAVTPRTWVFIDELRRAGRLESLPQLLVEGRSKGAGVVLGFQDLPGLTEVYGRDLAREIVGSCRNKGFLKLADSETAKYASEHFAQQEVEVTHFNPSSSTSRTYGQGGKSVSAQEGWSVSRSLHARAVVPIGSLMGIPECNPQNGIGGFFDTACVGEPYYGVLDGKLVQRYLVRPASGVPNFQPRPPEHLLLRPWAEPDLRRLGLTQFSSVLLGLEGRANQQTNPTAESSVSRPDDTDDLLNLLLKL